MTLRTNMPKYDAEHAEKDRKAGRLGHPDELPPEEFIGLPETGELPEWPAGSLEDARRDAGFTG